MIITQSIGVLSLIHALYDSNQNTRLYCMIIVAAMELFTYKQSQERMPFAIITSLQLINYCLTLYIVQQSIENYWLLIVIRVSIGSMVIKNGCQLIFGIKIANLIKYNTFTRVYYQAPLLYKSLHVISMLFIIFVYVQLEAHTIVMSDYKKISALVLANLVFIPFILLIIMNVLESYALAFGNTIRKQTKVE